MYDRNSSQKEEMHLEKRVFRAEKRTWNICESFECLYAKDEDCRINRDVKKAKVECPIKLDYCAKAYCSHCAKFMTETCPREHHGEVKAVVIKVVPDAKDGKNSNGGTH